MFAYCQFEAIIDEFPTKLEFLVKTEHDKTRIVKENCLGTLKIHSGCFD